MSGKKFKKNSIDKAGIDTALKALTKSYGKAYDVRGITDAVYQAIPTGYDDLDEVLTNGARGIYLGGIIEMFGPEGGGKCLVKDSLCLTHNGMMTVDEIFEDAGLKCDMGTGFFECNYEILNENNKFEKTDYLYKNSNADTNKKTIRIITSDGFGIEGTHKHPVRVIDDYGSVVWKNLSSIRKGDHICIQRDTRVWNEDSEITEDDATIISYYIGEGTLNHPGRLLFSNKDPDVVEMFFNCMKKCFGDIVNKIKKYDINYHLNSKEFYNIFCDKYKIKMVKSSYREIPKCIRCSSKKAQSAFIRAYFDGEGTFQEHKLNLQFCSASCLLLHQLQLLLLNFGIYSHITSTYNKKYCKEYYELELAGAELIKYNNVIGFNENQKSNNVLKNINMYLTNDVVSNTNIDLIPNQNIRLKSLYNSIDPEHRNRQSNDIFCDIVSREQQGLTYPRLNIIIDFCDSLVKEYGEYCLNTHILSELKSLSTRNFVFSSVIKIEKDTNKTYDFTMPETHSFWSNGFISHNSSLAMRTVAQAQNLGHNCLWIDAESGFSWDLAKINGVDLDKLIMPDLAELKVGSKNVTGIMDAAGVLKLVFDSVMTNAFTLIVVDSVAGLMPEVILKEDYEPNKAVVGGIAGAMSKELPKIAAACDKTKTSVLFVNQKRDKIGGYVQDRFHTPGGRALKHFASQRICVEKMGGDAGKVTVLDEDGSIDIIGHYAKVYIPKNKRAIPVERHHQLEVPIYYKEYDPDDADKCYQLARKINVITIRKGVLTWKIGDEVIFKLDGESAVLAKIRDEELEPRLAHACEFAAASEKNQSKKQPITVPNSIKKLASAYKLE